MPTQLRVRPVLWTAIAATVLLLAAACGPMELLQGLRQGQTPSQMPQELATLWQVWQILEQDFRGSEKLDQSLLSLGAIQGMVDALGEEEHSYLSPEDYDPGASDLGAVWQAWDLIWERLEGDDAAITPGQLQEAAIQGMLEALGNRYTWYLTTEYYELESRSYRSEFQGIGAYVNVSNQRLTIVAPMPDTPAERAGILTGDVIIEINGTPTAGLTLNEAVLRIRGPRGTSVDLLVLHLGQEDPQTITVVREVVKQTSVYWEPIEERIAYVRIGQFLDGTDKEIEEALREIESQAFDGLILDLRRNLGGLLSTTVAVAGHFLEEGSVLYQIEGQDNSKDMKVKGGGLTTDLPMVVLIDRASASGSELLTGALQDHGRATIIGTESFGKGSVNELRQLGDGSGLQLTVALFYTPEGRLIEGQGLAPDIFVPMDPRIPVGSALDIQLATALDYIRTQVATPIS